MTETPTFRILLQLVTVLIYLNGSLCVDISYHVEEEQREGTYVGDIAADFLLMSDSSLKHSSLISFNQLQKGAGGEMELFNVTKQGKLYTAHRLDAEELCTVKKECSRIIKVAAQLSERSSTQYMNILKVKIIIDDVNDHQPMFPTRELDLHFTERDGKGVMLAVPNAIDRDVGVVNSKISYQLRNNPDLPFTLSARKTITGSSELGIILARKLDREVKDSYNLQVIAKDGGYPSKQGVLDVHISVIDLNDNSPVFNKDIYNISVRNTHQRNRPIAMVSAKDLDSGENGHVSYFFSSETPEKVKTYFRLNHMTGEIFLQEAFRRAKKQNYELFIMAKDGGNPPRSSTAIVLVNVINERNNPPEIDINFVTQIKENTAAISEGTKVGSFIAYVSIIDNDTGQNGEVECKLEHDKFLLLDLGSNEFKITLKKPVDRETRDHYDISISCEDKGTPSLKTERKIFIQVTDINDGKPQFTKDTFKFLTYENGIPNFPIGFINATDQDLEAGGQLSYRLISNNINGIPFHVTDYGFISTSIVLDREQQDVYKFKVFVKDKGTPSLNNTANVVVEVLDENDNAPYFTFPSVDPFTLDVHYHPQSTSEITVIRASDRDSHLNAFLKYGILNGNNKQLFTLNSFTGQLSFSRPPHLNDAGSYQLVLVVKDSGSPVLSATTTVSLSVTVSNRTSSIMTATQLQPDAAIDLTLLIIIVVAAVIVSVVIVVSITLCIVKCNCGQSRSRTSRAVDQTVVCNRRDQTLTCQNTSTTPGNPVRYSSEMNKRNTQFVECKRDFYPQYESQSEWAATVSIEKRPPSTVQLPKWLPKR
ncbi:protocadherin beta-13-like isoform X1 [Octopus vulgaris]|nr:protocadherin beta-13-like isoform X1 [Octopus vulgaris]